MNTPARQFLTDYVIERATAESLQCRVKLYRALAAELPEECPQFKVLMAAADELESAEARTDQLLLNLRGGGR